jgi:calcineurin-like phosphoesterase
MPRAACDSCLGENAAGGFGLTCKMASASPGNCRVGRYTPASGPGTLCALFVETDAKGLAVRVEPVRVGGRLIRHLPQP